MDFNITTESPQQTIELGRRFGSQLKGGEVIALIGPLGSGKTHLIKGIVQALGAEDAANNVTSPTFVLVNEYSGRLDVFHVDAYRLKTVAEFEQIGFDDYCYPRSVVLIEWADKVIPALKGVKYITVKLAHFGPEKRSVNIDNLPDYVAF